MAISGALVALLLTSLPPRAEAAAVIMDLTVDLITRGRAVLQGDLDDTAFALPFPAATFEKANVEKVGKHWRVKASLTKRQIRPNVFQYDLTVEANHKSDPPPHQADGEAVSVLVIGGPAPEGIFHFNLTGVGVPEADDPGPPEDSDDVIHPGSDGHRDVLETRVDDLNGATPGFADHNNQISAVFKLTHTPEAATVVLVGSGLLGLAGLRRRGL
jgi:hypothetical protein